MECAGSCLAQQLSSRVWDAQSLTLPVASVERLSAPRQAVALARPQVPMCGGAGDCPPPGVSREVCTRPWAGVETLCCPCGRAFGGRRASVMRYSAASREPLATFLIASCAVELCSPDCPHRGVDAASGPLLGSVNREVESAGSSTLPAPPGCPPGPRSSACRPQATQLTGLGLRCALPLPFPPWSTRSGAVLSVPGAGCTAAFLASGELWQPEKSPGDATGQLE